MHRRDFIEFYSAVCSNSSQRLFISFFKVMWPSVKLVWSVRWTGIPNPLCREIKKSEFVLIFNYEFLNVSKDSCFLSSCFFFFRNPLRLNITAFNSCFADLTLFLFLCLPPKCTEILDSNLDQHFRMYSIKNLQTHLQTEFSYRFARIWPRQRWSDILVSTLMLI